MRRTWRLLVGLILIQVLSVAPSSADLPRYEVEGEIAISNWTPETGVLPSKHFGVTGTEFMSSCQIPSTQGLDGQVVELPQEYGELGGHAALDQVSAATHHKNLYLVFFDPECVVLRSASLGGFYASISPVEPYPASEMPRGTRYILVGATIGVDLKFRLVVTPSGEPGGGPTEPGPDPKPTEPGPNPEPEPTEPGEVRRAVTLELRKHLHARGTVESDGEQCVFGASVVIERKKNGEWLTVRSTVSDENGDFIARLTDRPGRYRARVAGTAGDGSSCAEAISSVVRHQH